MNSGISEEALLNQLIKVTKIAHENPVLTIVTLNPSNYFNFNISVALRTLYIDHHDR